MELFWSTCGLDAMANDHDAHEEAVKKATLLRLLLVIALLAFVAGCWLRGCVASSEIESLNNTSRSNSVVLEVYKNENADLSSKVISAKIENNENMRRKDAEISKVTSELLTTQQRLTSFESLPANILNLYTNTANLFLNEPTNRAQLASLLLSVQSFTNAVSELSKSPLFDLYINDVRLTNGTVISLHESRLLKIQALNSSDITARGLSISFLCPSALDKTNVIANGWDFMPQIPENPSNIRNHWLWTASRTAPGGITYNIDSLEISTNVSFPVIRVGFKLWSDSSRIQAFDLVLTF